MMEKLKDDPAVVEEVIKLLRKLPWQVRGGAVRLFFFFFASHVYYEV